MKISPVNIYSYRQSFTSTQKPKNTKTTNSLTDIEKQQKAQEALAEINELKQEAQKNYQDAKYYLNKSKIFYQEIRGIKNDPAGLEYAPENTVFVPKDINGAKTISYYDTAGGLISQRLFTPNNEIIMVAPSIYGSDYFDRVYINKDKNYAVVNLGRKESIDFEENQEVYEFQGNQLKRCAIDSSANGIMDSSEAKNYRYYNGEPISISLDAQKNTKFIKAASTFVFKDGELVISRKNYIKNGTLDKDDASYYKNELGEEIYEKDNYIITFKDGKMINFVENE